jgi:hypothetical protein
MRFFLILMVLFPILIWGSYPLFENARRDDNYEDINKINLKNALNALKTVDNSFCILPCARKNLTFLLENETFGKTWRFSSTETKLTEILQNYINQKRDGQEIILNVPINASYQRCMRANFIENLNRKNNGDPYPNFDRLLLLMNNSYAHFMYAWTSKSIEKNYNPPASGVNDEIQDIFKAIKNYYVQEVKFQVNAFFAKIDLKNINFVELEEKSKQVIPHI